MNRANPLRALPEFFCYRRTGPMDFAGRSLRGRQTIQKIEFGVQKLIFSAKIKLSTIRVAFAAETHQK